MRPPSDPLPRELEEALDAVRPRLGPLGTSWLYYTTVGSTNDVAAALAGGPGEVEGAVVLADAQTAGRGRRGRTWFSPPGSGLYMSVVLLPGRARSSPERVTSLLTLAAGVAVAEAIERVTGLAPDIKWPNDLLVGRRKLAGILAEGVVVDRATRSASIGYVVLGYGINVGLMSVPANLLERTTSLESELGRAVDRAAVAAETLAALAARYDDLLAGRFDAILDAWRVRSPSSVGARVTWAPGGTLGIAGMVETATLGGVTAGIDEDGALLVRTPRATERVVAGELTWEI